MKKYILDQRRLPDLTLLVVVLLLLTIGLIMVYSASHVWAEYKYDDSFFFVKRQLLFAGVGIILMMFITFIPYDIWRKYVHVILFFCFLLLLLVLVPGIGIVRGGAQSWIGVGAFSIQPSEFIKLGLILFLAHYLTVNHHKITTFGRGFIWPISLIFIVFALIMLQPDFGTGVVLVITCVFMLLFLERD